MPMCWTGSMRMTRLRSISSDMEIRYYQELPSTSRTAAEAAREGAAHLFTVVAESPTEGRGRLQRSFFSPRGGLYFTTVLRTDLLPKEYGALTPFAAVAVHRAIRRVCGVETEIKWVNDLLWNGKKVCGILAESGVDLNGRAYVLLGIGINLSPVEFPAELSQIATCVPCEDKEKLLSEILRELSEAEAAVRQASWLADYRADCRMLGSRVTVMRQGTEAHATAVDILSDGALLVLWPGGAYEELRGGEISLRAAQFPKK